MAENDIIRGTTPVHVFNIPFDTRDIEKYTVTYSAITSDGKSRTVLKLTQDDSEMYGTQIVVALTQEQTLLFSEYTAVKIQVKVLTTSGSVFASKILWKTIGEILDEGVL